MSSKLYWKVHIAAHSECTLCYFVNFIAVAMFYCRQMAQAALQMGLPRSVVSIEHCEFQYLLEPVPTDATKAIIAQASSLLKARALNGQWRTLID